MTYLLLLALFAPLAAPAGAAPAPADFRADAAAIEGLIDTYYAYLDRFPDQRAPLTAALRAEAAKVDDRPSLIRYAERALLTLADHHAMTGSARPDSWAIVPTFGDLWIERRCGEYAVTAVRAGSPAADAKVRVGDRLVAVGGAPIEAAVDAFWADLGGETGTDERAGFAARLLAAGRRDRPRALTVQWALEPPRALTLPNLYSVQRAERPPLSHRVQGGALVIEVHNALGDSATIAAFDAAMATARPQQPVVIDLTDTPSGGNTTVARAMMSWFVDRPRFYQRHNFAAEQRRSGVARQWVEEVLPRAGKHHDGPVTVRVGRWTGSMGEGLAIGFDALGARVEGGRMAGLLGAVHDHRLEHSGLLIKLPIEKLFAVDGTPREDFLPKAPTAP